MILPELSRSKALFHLGYTQATPALARAAIEAAFSTIPDTYTLGKIELLITNCETAWAAVFSPALVEDTREVITGDSNLVTSDSKVPTRQQLDRTYSLAVSQLARSLGVVNFRDQSNYPVLEGDYSTLSALLDGYSLNGLTDVLITSPVNNQVLKYNGTNWVNATL